MAYIILLGGYPGSGKSTLAFKLAPFWGAQVISSDRIRKAMFNAGAQEAETLPPEAYNKTNSRAVRERIINTARHFINDGDNVIIDRVTCNQGMRDELAELGTVFPFWLQVSPSDAYERIAKRKKGASDVTAKNMHTICPDMRKGNLDMDNWIGIPNRNMDNAIAQINSILHHRTVNDRITAR